MAIQSNFDMAVLKMAGNNLRIQAISCLLFWCSMVVVSCWNICFISSNKTVGKAPCLITWDSQAKVIDLSLLVSCMGLSCRIQFPIIQTQSSSTVMLVQFCRLYTMFDIFLSFRGTLIFASAAGQERGLCFSSFTPPSSAMRVMTSRFGRKLRTTLLMRDV